MVQTEHIDPTGFGLLLVAAVSLPGALDLLLTGNVNAWTSGSDIAAVIGTMLLIVALLAYKANSTFGMTVFGLVGTGVLCVGGGSAIFGGAAAGTGALLVFGIIYLFCIFWSVAAKTPKLLTLLLVTTALIFLVAGINTLITDADLAKNMGYVLGVIYLFNFIFNFWLGAGLCCDKIKTF
ncbi:MAG: hypothetical protein MJZ38_05900 [archaeon]|nr:hypothetical protein [archaeon]